MSRNKGTPETPSGSAAPARPIGYPILQARGLWYSYDRRRVVLANVDLDVDAGAMTTILGRSGSGKTTLLKVLKGLLKPQRGSIHVAAPNGARIAGAVAYVPQTLGLVRSSTALENALAGSLSRVGTARSLLSIFPGQIVDEAKETIARLGLAHKIHEPVWALSGGERQRIAIARALMQHPALILADEFVSQLDPITAEGILNIMAEIVSDSRVGLLVTTHETDVVEQYADRVIIMAEGRIVHDTPGGHLKQHEMIDLLR